MTDTFKECHNDLLALFPPKSKRQAEVHRDDCWHVLQYNVPIIREIFNRVRREWRGVSLPSVHFIEEIRQEVRYGEKERSIWHKVDSNGDPHPDCGCEGCKLYNRAIEGICLNLKCNRERSLGDEFCDRCHIVAKSYSCLCNLCEDHRKRLLDAEKAEIDENLSF
jgi:hypothetical protein